MLFEIATLTGSVFTAHDVKTKTCGWLDDAPGGVVLGMWTTDVGRIGDLVILRAFDDAVALDAERRRALSSADAFGAASVGARLIMESYAPFPFLPEPRPRDYGGVFEMRTYQLTPGGLPATLAAWKDAVGPAERYTDHLVTALYGLDGDLRITHIWGFSSVQERIDLRRDHYARGLWPPKGGPEHIDHANSTIMMSEPGFPIC